MFLISQQRLRRSTFSALAAFTLLSHTAAAQQISSQCYRFVRPTARDLPVPGDSINPYSDRGRLLAWKLLRILRSASNSGAPFSSVPTPEARSQVLRLWHQRPEAVRWGLAFLVAAEGSSGLSTASTAWQATTLYRELSGDPRPLVYILSTSGSDGRRSLSLIAMRPPLDSVSENAVFGYACDAAWLLTAVQGDSLQRDVTGPSMSALVEAPLVLRLAYQLVSVERRRLIEELAVRADSSNGLKWLKESQDSSRLK